MVLPLKNVVLPLKCSGRRQAGGASEYKAHGKGKRQGQRERVVEVKTENREEECIRMNA